MFYVSTRNYNEFLKIIESKSFYLWLLQFYSRSSQSSSILLLIFLIFLLILSLNHFLIFYCVSPLNFICFVFLYTLMLSSHCILEPTTYSLLFLPSFYALTSSLYFISTPLILWCVASFKTIMRSLTYDPSILTLVLSAPVDPLLGFWPPFSPCAFLHISFLYASTCLFMHNSPFFLHWSPLLYITPIAYKETSSFFLSLFFPWCFTCYYIFFLIPIYNAI